MYACGCNEHGQCGVPPLDKSSGQTDKVKSCCGYCHHKEKCIHTYEVSHNQFLCTVHYCFSTSTFCVKQLHILKAIMSLCPRV